MQETPTDQIVDDAAPVLHEFGRTFDVIDICSGNTWVFVTTNLNISHRFI